MQTDVFEVKSKSNRRRSSSFTNHVPTYIRNTQTFESKEWRYDNNKKEMKNVASTNAE